MPPNRVIIKGKVKITLKPIASIMEKVMIAVTIGFEKFTKLVVAGAVRISVIKDILDTGKNILSIGWAKSKWGTVKFTPLKTAMGTDEVPINETANKNIVDFIIATTSGYGGWLEVGTRLHPARSYIMDSFFKEKNQLKSLLTGVIK